MKKIIIFMLAFVLAFGSVTTAFATDTDTTFTLPEPPTTDELPYAFVYWFTDSSGHIFYVCYIHNDSSLNSFMKYYESSSDTDFDDIYFTLLIEGPSITYRCTLDSSYSEWVLRSDNSTKSFVNQIMTYTELDNLDEEAATTIFRNHIVYSDVDVYSDNIDLDGDGNYCFFFKTQRNTTLFSSNLSSQQITNQLMTPTIGLIPLVIGLVILVLALRKVWVQLSTALKRV